MAPDYEFDVFISYSSTDQEWVRGELLHRIEQVGLTAFIDFRDFTRGAPSIKECERGVIKCRKTLIILTPAYIQSEWCEIENIMCQTLDPANRELRLIPILKEECKKPLRVVALTHIDFTSGADHALAWRQLLTALGKPPEPEPPKPLERSDWFLAHPYPMPPNFTGRVTDRTMLTQWLDADSSNPLLVLQALGGFGKSALAWHWLTHDVDPAEWPRVVWWSFYEGDASFDHFLADTLGYLTEGKVKPDRLSVYEVRALLQLLNSPGTLLVLDGFERVLRAFSGLDAAYQGDVPAPYIDHNTTSGVMPPPSCHSDRDCISPLAEQFLRYLPGQPHLHSKVLLTTRLYPRVLEVKGGGFLQGCRVEKLGQMEPDDAVEFFRAQGIRGTHTEIETACGPYGYHPLSLRLLTGLIMGDFQQPGDIAVASRLDVSGDLVQRRHHILETAYNNLTPERQKLLGRIACFRNPVKYDALKAIAAADDQVQSQRLKDEESQDKSSLLPPSAFTRNLDTDLRDLIARGLLYHDIVESRFDLHPIVRRYAYDRLTAPERTAAHARLRDYFAAVPEPNQITRLEDLAPVIELYHHTVHAGQFDEAWSLFHDRILKSLYFQLGGYLLMTDLLRVLFVDGEDQPPFLKTKRDQSSAANALANAYLRCGHPCLAVTLYGLSVQLDENVNDKKSLAVVLANLAWSQVCLGTLRAAESSLRRSIALSRNNGDKFDEAIGHSDLGLLLAYCGVYFESTIRLTFALSLFGDLKAVQYQGVTWSYEAERELVLLRSNSHSAVGNPQSAIDSARRALQLANETARTDHPFPRDYVHTHWLLGAAHRVAGQTDLAQLHLHQALETCRHINLVDHEAAILIDLARLHADTGTPGEAQRLAEEALLITERCGYVLQSADAHLELAKLARARGDQATALDHAKDARCLATCDGPPDYTYKVAYEEAGALLAELGGST